MHEFSPPPSSLVLISNCAVYSVPIPFWSEGKLPNDEAMASLLWTSFNFLCMSGSVAVTRSFSAQMPQHESCIFTVAYEAMPNIFIRLSPSNGMARFNCLTLLKRRRKRIRKYHQKLHLVPIQHAVCSMCNVHCAFKYVQLHMYMEYHFSSTFDAFFRPVSPWNHTYGTWNIFRLFPLIWQSMGNFAFYVTKIHYFQAFNH